MYPIGPGTTPAPTADPSSAAVTAAGSSAPTARPTLQLLLPSCLSDITGSSAAASALALYNKIRYGPRATAGAQGRAAASSPETAPGQQGQQAGDAAAAAAAGQSARASHQQAHGVAVAMEVEVKQEPSTTPPGSLGVEGMPLNPLGQPESSAADHRAESAQPAVAGSAPYQPLMVCRVEVDGQEQGLRSQQLHTADTQGPGAQTPPPTALDSDHQTLPGVTSSSLHCSYAWCVRNSSSSNSSSGCSTSGVGYDRGALLNRSAGASGTLQHQQQQQPDSAWVSICWTDSTGEFLDSTVVLVTAPTAQHTGPGKQRLLAGGWCGSYGAPVAGSEGQRGAAMLRGHTARPAHQQRQMPAPSLVDLVCSAVVRESARVWAAHVGASASGSPISSTTNTSGTNTTNSSSATGTSTSAAQSAQATVERLVITKLGRMSSSETSAWSRLVSAGVMEQQRWWCQCQPGTQAQTQAQASPSESPDPPAQPRQHQHQGHHHNHSLNQLQLSGPAPRLLVGCLEPGSSVPLDPCQLLLTSGQGLPLGAFMLEAQQHAGAHHQHHASHGVAGNGMVGVAGKGRGRADGLPGSCEEAAGSAALLLFSPDPWPQAPASSSSARSVAAAASSSSSSTSSSVLHHWRLDLVADSHKGSAISAPRVVKERVLAPAMQATAALGGTTTEGMSLPPPPPIPGGGVSLSRKGSMGGDGGGDYAPQQRGGRLPPPPPHRDSNGTAAGDWDADEPLRHAHSTGGGLPPPPPRISSGSADPGSLPPPPPLPPLPPNSLPLPPPPPLPPGGLNGVEEDGGRKGASAPSSGRPSPSLTPMELDPPDGQEAGQAYTPSSSTPGVHVRPHSCAAAPVFVSAHVCSARVSLIY